MGEKTAIGWCHNTFNPWWGCVRVSPGCENCYAEVWSKRRGHKVWGPKTNTHRLLFGAKHWEAPYRWNARAEKTGVRERTFCGSMCDVFEDHLEVFHARMALYGVIEETPWLDWLLLTKRIENVMDMRPGEWIDHGFPPNVWIGFSAENQKLMDERSRVAVQIPAAVRFVSIEPQLEHIDAGRYLEGWDSEAVHVCGGDNERCFRMCPEEEQYQTLTLDWVINGGESGPGARPYDPAWGRSLREQCHSAGRPFYFKQVGSVLGNGKGEELADIPADLHVREYPA